MAGDRKELRLQAEREVVDLLEQAANAADAGDILEEERLLDAAREKALSFRDGWRGNLGVFCTQQIKAMRLAGRVRRGQPIGECGNVYCWEDRIIVPGTGVYVLDAKVRASVETTGSITATTHPTLTRMAAGAVLPGSALIPGLAFQKTKVHDSRELYFTLEHPDWAYIEQVHPDQGLAARELAAAVNLAARRQEPEGGRDDAGPAPDPLDRLKKLGELRDSGVITEEEFAKHKAKLLGQL